MDAPKEQLLSLRNGLLGLHKTLLDSERAGYEHDIARIESPGAFLELVLHDPWFAWLRELSQFIVMIDETLAAETPPSATDATNLVRQARALLIPAEEGRGFGKRYFDALQRDPDVVMAHSEMRKLLTSLAS